MTPKTNAYVDGLHKRIRRLEDELLRRPTVGQLEHMIERTARQKRLYEAVLARNEVLRRRLEEMAGR